MALEIVTKTAEEPPAAKIIEGEAPEQKRISVAPLLLALLAASAFVGGAGLHVWRRAHEKAPVKLHVLPSNAVLGYQDRLPVASQKDFAAVLGGKAGAYVSNAPQAPVDIEANLPEEPAFAISISATLRISPVANDPPSPPHPPPPQPPSTPPHPPPYWVLESQLPPRAKNHRGNATLASLARSAPAVEVLDPRPGTVLLARDAFPDQPYLQDSVVLLVKVCSCHPNIFGLILSGAPSNLTLGDVTADASARFPTFVNASLRAGGPVGPMWATVEPFAATGSIEVTPGLHVGGCLVDLGRRVAAGLGSASDVSFFSGYIAWPIARLQEEIEEGKWAVASASASLLLAGLKDNSLSAAAISATML